MFVDGQTDKVNQLLNPTFRFACMGQKAVVKKLLFRRSYHACIEADVILLSIPDDKGNLALRPINSHLVL